MSSYGVESNWIAINKPHFQPANFSNAAPLNFAKLMTRYLRAVFFSGILGTTCLSAHASDPLWNKAVAHSVEMSKWVAQDIESDIEALDGDIFHLKSTLHLNGWNKGKPQYAISQLSIEPKMPNEKVPSPSDFDAIARLADIVLSENFAVTRTDNQLRNGRLWTKFQWGTKKNAATGTYTAWVSPETGCLHELDSNIHVPLMADVNATSHYVKDEQERCLLKQVEMNITSLVPFQRGKVHIKKTPLTWIEKPRL